jgi:hypothetical protein
VSVPAISSEVESVRLYALPEYEPPLLSSPPDPDGDPTARWSSLDPVPLQRVRVCPPVFSPPEDAPVWDETGPLRDTLWRMLCLILEVMDGRRPIGQLRPAVDARLYEALLTRSRQFGAAGTVHRPRSLHTCRPVANTVELCATVHVSAPSTNLRRRPDVITVAGRVEHHRGRWLCTVLRPLHSPRSAALL